MSREAIIRQIVRRDLANKDLREQAIAKKEPALYELACDEFGSWLTALEYAGVDQRVAGISDKKWTPERIRRRLRRLCTKGYDLNAKVNRIRNRALHQAVLHHFRSWRGGLRAAGINLTNVSRHGPKKLEVDTMILWLRERKAAGQTLVWREICLENRNYAMAIRHRFRSWRKALEAAGVRDVT